ncbi:hypothetical protein G6F43_011071 [Rhizopus delemar]|nr:hypothetical protein G6F43_011071 [Rhizopus delemar]
MIRHSDFLKPSACDFQQEGLCSIALLPLHTQGLHGPSRQDSTAMDSMRTLSASKEVQQGTDPVRDRLAGPDEDDRIEC